MIVSLASLFVLVESVLMYVTCPELYNSPATELVLDTDHPNVELAACNIVSVVKGGFGLLLLLPSLIVTISMVLF